MILRLAFRIQVVPWGIGNDTNTLKGKRSWSTYVLNYINMSSLFSHCSLLLPWSEHINENISFKWHQYQSVEPLTHPSFIERENFLRNVSFQDIREIVLDKSPRRNHIVYVKHPCKLMKNWRTDENYYRITMNISANKERTSMHRLLTRRVHIDGVSSLMTLCIKVILF